MQVVETSERGHATRFAHDAAERGVDTVVAFGGDGTLNEVATGLAGSNTALMMLPGGSTNVFVRSLGASNDPVIALQQFSSGLDHDNVHPISLGRANGRYFCFHAGIGFDAAVVELVERRASLKRIIGQPLFALSAAQAWFKTYDKKYPHFSVEVDGKKIPNGFLTIVLNSNPYTYIGKRAVNLSTAASIDKKLVAITFRKLTTPLMVRTVLQALRQDQISASSGIEVRTDVEDVKINFATPFPYQLDGDYLGEQTSLHIEHRPEAIRLVKPIII